MKTRYSISASTFDKKGNLIAQGTNCYKKTSPFQKKFAIMVQKPDRIFWHAECNAMQRSLRTNKVVDRIVVIRYDASGALALAKPCDMCMTMLKHYNVRKVIYSTSEGMKELLI